MTTAIDIKKALSNIYVLESIGNCPTMIQAYKEEQGIADSDDEDEDEEEDEENEESEAQKDIKSKKQQESNDVRIFRSQAIFEHTKHSCRTQSTPFVISSSNSQFLHPLGISMTSSISELLVRAASLTASSAHVPTLF